MLGVETGALSIFGVTERAFEPAGIAAILAEAGFPQVEFHPGWDGLTFDDSSDWLVAIGR